MMTLYKILANVNLSSKERSEYVKVVSVKYGKSKATKFPKAVARTYTKRDEYTSPSKYYCSITQINAKGAVKVSCSCPWFLYRGYEYVLAKRGAADIIYGNGEAPTKPCPAGCCKHLFMLAKELHKAGKLKGDLTFKDQP